MEINLEQGVATSIVFPLLATGGATRISGATLAAGDVKIARHIGGVWDVSNPATPVPTEIGSSGVYVLPLTATELTVDDLIYDIVVTCHDVVGGEWDDQAIVIRLYVIPAPSFIPVPGTMPNTLTSTQYYCTVQELVRDMQMPGGVKDIESALRAIRKAGDTIARKIGNFAPYYATKNMNGIYPKTHLMLPSPLLSIGAVVNDSVLLVSTDYAVFPLNGHWARGPITALDMVNPDKYWSAEKQGIAITGTWGMYEYAYPLTVLDAAQDDFETSIVVANGARLSPGLMLLLGNEQEAVVDYGDPVTATSILTDDVDATAEEIPVTDVDEFFAGEIIRVGVEDMLLVRKGTNTWAVERHYNGSLATSHADDDPIGVMREFVVERALNGSSGEAHLDGADVYRVDFPGDIHDLALEIAGIHYRLAGAGYSHKTGGGDAGETTIPSEYPKALDIVADHYRTGAFRL